MAENITIFVSALIFNSHIIMKKALYLLPLVGLAACQQKIQSPNIIIILADDLGFGDVSANGSATISTPNFDRMAHGGINFINGYATSATSTPSRYALMTGMYPWKDPAVKILPGDAPLVISTTLYTMPRMMQQNGYATGAIGKWHLGMGDGNTDWNTFITPGANEIGFDYSCIIAATNDRVPTVYVENGYVVGLDAADRIYVDYDRNFPGEPTGRENPELLKMHPAHGHADAIVNGISRIGFMKGGKAARWIDEDMADYFIDKVKTFIDNHKDSPFFLYYGLHQPHVPRVTHQRFVGTTTMGPRGDAIVEADWCVGQLLDHLEKNGLLENTIIIFSSDNGPVLNDGYKDMAAENVGDHKPAGNRRGGKYSLFEAGTHVPFFVYWKGTIKPGVSDALVCQMDLAASLGALTGGKVPEGLDSRNLLKAFMGKSNKGREDLIVEAQGRLALRDKQWVMIPPYKGEERNLTGNELGNLPDFALFDMSSDPGQTTDLAAKHPEELEKLKKRFFALTDGYYRSDVGDVPLK